MPVLTPYFLCRAVGGNHNTVTTSSAADLPGAAFELGIEGNLATREEALAIHVKYPVGARCAYKR
jgi:hypothetical protein